MAQVYVYGIVPSDRCWRPDGFAGVHGAPVRLLPHRSLAALVSDIEREVPGRRRELVAHTTVLEQALEVSSILPATFGTVAPTEAAVRDDLLSRRHERLVDLLAQVEGLVEVRVSGVYDEEALVEEVVRRNPALRHGGDRLERGRRVVEAIDQQRRADVALLLEALGPHARDLREQPPRGELGLADLAFLVERQQLAAFDDVVTAAALPLGGRAKLRYVGPLPPASFVALDAA